MRERENCLSIISIGFEGEKEYTPNRMCLPKENREKEKTNSTLSFSREAKIRRSKEREKKSQKGLNDSEGRRKDGKTCTKYIYVNVHETKLTRSEEVKSSFEEVLEGRMEEDGRKNWTEEEKKMPQDKSSRGIRDEKEDLVLIEIP